MTEPKPPPRPPCLDDPLSVVGLRALARDVPYWPERLRRPPGDDSPDDGSLRSLLLAHAVDLWASPEPPGVETIYRTRQLARVVCEVAGGWAVERAVACPDELRAALSARRPGTGRPTLSPDRISRAMTMVRRAYDHRAVAEGGPALPRTRAAAAARRRPRRTTIPLGLFEQLLRHATPAERVKLGLALGAGLSPGQVDELRASDVRRRALSSAAAAKLRVPDGTPLDWVRVAADPTGSRVRWLPLPPWVSALIAAAELVPEQHGRLVSADRAPSLYAILRRLRRVVPGATKVTPTSLVVTWQGVARDHGQPRSVVRRSWSQPRDGEKSWPSRWHPNQVRLRELALAWAWLANLRFERFIHGVVDVPRRAPRGRGAREPEKGPRKVKVRRPAPMPLLARLDGLKVGRGVPFGELVAGASERTPMQVRPRGTAGTSAPPGGEDWVALVLNASSPEDLVNPGWPRR